MSRDASVTLDWADGTYTFRLAWGQLRELQERCDAGPFVIYRRIHAGEWRIDDLAQVLRIGLIGGGLSPDKARSLVRAYVEERPPMESVLFAQAVLWAGIAGAPDGDDAQKKSREPSASTTSRTASSATPPSTE